MTGLVVITLVIVAMAYAVYCFITAPIGFQHDGHWFPGTPEEWGIDPADTE
jgi:hypothetical protein